MSIGKSSIKRAANNGYSNVKTTAPDMENSVVVEVKEEAPVVETPVVEVPVAAAPAEGAKTPAKAKKPAAKKAAPKKACAPKKTANKELEKAVRLGDDMPYYLL